MRLLEVILLYIPLIIANNVEGRQLTWLPSDNVLSPENWDHSAINCAGIIFPEVAGSMNIHSTRTRKIQFPLNGEILLFEGTEITLDETDKTCIKLKPKENRFFFDPRNWGGIPVNRAVPDAETVPCDYDDLVFNENSTQLIETVVPMDWLNAKSVMLGSKKQPKTPEGLLDVTPESNLYFLGINHINISTQETCAQNEACLCTNTQYAPLVCHMVKSYRNDTEYCKDAIIPKGFCTTICGASFHFDKSENLEKIIKLIKQNSENIDFHISLFFDSYNDKLSKQLVLVDKEDYTGGSYSVQFAKDLDEELQKGPTISYSIFLSGTPVRTKEVLDITLGIIFGALFVVVVFFVVIYAVYVGPLEHYRFDLRGIHNQRKFRPFVFAKFDNKDEGILTFEQSLGSSVASLTKAFDNPLYGKEIPSTSQSYSEINSEMQPEQAEEMQELQKYEEVGLHAIEQEEDV